MKNLFWLIISLCIGFITNIDIDWDEVYNIYDLIENETYNFYSPVNQLNRISIQLLFDSFIYLPFNCVYINEYASRNGTSLRSYIIKNLRDYESDEFYFNYNLENFSSTYFSFSFKSNSTIASVEIILSFNGGLYNLSNGVKKGFYNFFQHTPYYLVIPTLSYSKIKVEVNSNSKNDLENLNLTLIEYQKNNSDYYIYESQNYTNYSIDDDETTIRTISFNYLTKNKNTNFFCIKILSLYHNIRYLDVRLSDDRYYITLYDKESFDIFDLKINQIYRIYLEAKMNQIFNINFTIFEKDFNDTLLPLNSMIIHEDTEEFSSKHLSTINRSIKTLSESFLYGVSEPDTKYLSIYITPLFQIEKLNIAYNMTKEIKSIFNLENNTLLIFPEVYPYIKYNLTINSKILEELEYEITIKNTNISSPPFQYISLIENPSNVSQTDDLTFKKEGNDIKASKVFKNTHCNTENTTFLIISEEYVKFCSIKVKVTGRNLYYLTKELKKNIALILEKHDYYFVIETENNIREIISINITYKLNSEFSHYLGPIDYYTESKTEFKIGYPSHNYINFHKNGDEFSGTAEFDFTNNYHKFEILLLKITPLKSLSDFNIAYNFVYKKNSEKSGSDKTFIYVLIPISVLGVIALVTTVARYNCEKKANSNLIEGNIETNETLLPQEEDKEQK